MKLNIQTILPFLLRLVIFLLVCTLISTLYTFDVISTHFFDAACLFTGCLFYMMLAVSFFKVIKKRQFVIALVLVIIAFLIELMFHSFSKVLIQKSMKLLLFLLTVAVLQFKHHS